MSELSRLVAAAAAEPSGNPMRMLVEFRYEALEPTVLLDAATRDDLRRLCRWLEEPAVVDRFIHAIGVALDQAISR